LQTCFCVNQRNAMTTHRPPLPGVRCGKVVCWVDSFVRRDHCVAVARALARSESGFHEVVLCLDSPCRSRQAAELCASGPLTPAVLGQAQARLAELYSWESPTLVLPGHPPAEIRRYARHTGVDLLVMGEQALAQEQEYEDWICGDPPCAVLVLVLPPSDRAAPLDDNSPSPGRDGSPR